ncbi:MAG: PEP-CTERM sorting domain-containing protein [Phycisphaeraceae bacterium]|nr:PEP-CTERM sorting domain-containing protein [Phycisphaeraceae bacterium]
MTGQLTRTSLWLAAILFAAVPVMGQTVYVWTNNAADNDFTNLNNWYQEGTTTLPTVPFTATDNLLVEKDGTDKAVLSSATLGRWLRAGWYPGTIGLIEVVSGGQADLSNSIYLGYDATAVGTLNIMGGVVNANSSYTTIGGLGQASLTISSGSLSTNRMNMGHEASGSGVLEVSGTGSLYIDNYLSGNLGDSTVRLIGSTASFQINDDLTADAQGTNLFEFQLDGANGVGTGIVVTNVIDLAANAQVDVSFLGASVNGTYTLMSTTGTFTDNTGGSLLTAASVTAGWSYAIVDDAGTKKLQVTLGSGYHPGDANGDGLVNLSDLQILGDNWQSTTAGWAEADFTGDNVVNLADLQILGDNWGFGTGPDVSFDEALAQVAIPEPASLCMLLLGGLLATLRRRGG